MSFLHSERSTRGYASSASGTFMKWRMLWRTLCRLSRRRFLMRLLVGLLLAGLAATAAPPRIEADGGANTAVARSVGWREITIPAGTSLPVVLDTSVGPDISRVEQPAPGHLAPAIPRNG